MGSLSVAILLLLHVGAEVDDLVCSPADASPPRFGASVYHAVRLPVDRVARIGDHDAGIRDHDAEIGLITMPETR
jgi:hypothetical protein